MRPDKGQTNHSATYTSKTSVILSVAISYSVFRRANKMACAYQTVRMSVHQYLIPKVSHVLQCLYGFLVKRQRQIQDFWNKVRMYKFMGVLLLNLPHFSISHENEIIWPKLFHFHRIFKTGMRRGVGGSSQFVEPPLDPPLNGYCWRCFMFFAICMQVCKLVF